MKVFAFKHKELDRVAVVIAPDEEAAFKELAIAEQDGDDDTSHVRKFWEIEASGAADVPGAILAANVDASEGYELFLKN